MRLRLTVRARLLLTCVLPLAVAMAAVLIFVLWSYYRDLLRESELRLRAEVNEAGLRIELANVTALTVPKTMALAQEAGLFGNRRVSLEFARKILEAFPEFTGAYFGYEPEGDKGRSPAAEAQGIPGEAQDSGGRFIPYWHRAVEDPTRVRLSPLAGLESSYYYRGVKNRHEGRAEDEGVELSGGVSRLYRHALHPQQSGRSAMVTEPYDYEGKYMVEHSVPLVVDGRFQGIAGVDRALNDIDRVLRDMHRHESGGFFLLSQRGRVIASTLDPAARARPIEDSGWGAVLEPAYLDRKAGSLQMAKDPRNGEETYFASTHLATGDWTLVLAVSRAEILAGLSETVERALAVSAGVLASVLGISLLALRTMMRRLEAAASVAAQVAAGDLSSPLEAAGGDEIGDLILALGVMRQALADLVGRVKRSSQQLVAVGEEIAAASGHEEKRARDFGELTRQIAASVREISATGEATVCNIADVARATSDTADAAATGKQSLYDTEAAMQRMNAGMASVAEGFSAIGDQAESINDIMAAMTDIAVQTNLLSLNASIEAEKAGRQGAGFAVVANEIRRLADQSAVAALDVEQRVYRMRQVVARGVQEMEAFQAEVSGGLIEIERLGEHFAGVSAGVEQLSPRFGQVYENMRTQAAGAQQIDQAMSGLKDDAQGAAKSSANLRQMVVKLDAAVQDLLGEIARFKV